MQDIKNLLSSPANRERLFLATAGLFQGLATWIVVRIDPHEPLEKALYFGVLAWILSSGLLFQFASSGTHHRRLAGVALGLALPFALLTYHVIGQLPLKDAHYDGDGLRVGTWCGAAILALYIVLPYLQIYQRSSRLQFPYPDLYRHSWNNFFVAGLGWFYSGVYWALMWICAELFKALGIDAIEKLITKPSFMAITTGIMAGLGVALAKEHAQIIATLRAITATLFRSLTPLLVVIVLSFLVALPFTGLTPLWATKWASAILLALLLLILLFVNAVFQDGEGACPYGHLLRRGVEATLMSMPILVGLTIYSMNLRISQYGFTPERYYAIVFAIVLGGYALGYAWSVVKTGPSWLGGIRGFNIALSFVVFGLAFTLHTPLMDPLKRSADDQMKRLLSGQTELSKFDFGTLRFELGHYGQGVLDRLALLTTHPQHQQITDQLTKLKAAQHKWEWTNIAIQVTPEQITARLIITPLNHSVPADLLIAIQETTNRSVLDTCTTTRRCDLIAGQWDDDPDLEYVLLADCGHKTKSCYPVVLYKRFGTSTWKQVASVSVNEESDSLTRENILAAAREGRLSFGGIQYHCLTMDNTKVCDYWGKEQN